MFFFTNMFFYVFFEKNFSTSNRSESVTIGKSKENGSFKKKFAPKPRSGADLWSILVFKKTCFKTCFRTCFWRILKLTINQPGIEISRRNFFLKWSIFYALSNGYNIIEIWGQLIFFDFFTENMFSEHVFGKTLKLTISRLRIEVSGRIFFLKWSIFSALSDGDIFRAIRGQKFFFEKNVKKTCS